MHLLSPLSLSLSLSLLTTTTTVLLHATASPTSHSHTHTNNRRALSLLPTLHNLNRDALDLTKLSNNDLTEPDNSETLNTLNEVLDQLPLAIEFWALNRTAGVVGLSLDMGLTELADFGLVSLGSPGARSNAKVHVNVTITGLGDEN
ncbi:hypothetical protein BO99DRAFT_466957 [Aspergillus violaceofuscus CBS 115571]|uniref:Uncharacterized protein n=1 Tax=Aspergillus violaceofuscus (strain CBS 115571) TaxID=1450538 RepID=A0A2V5GWT4_ASPV1|nr:hypothetical protein BO99DRAFT_466957 [Aspergillus violaceofuscus CBS 115571]